MELVLPMAMYSSVRTDDGLEFAVTGGVPMKCVITEASLYALDGSGTDPYSLLLHTTRTQYMQHRQDVNEQLQQCTTRNAITGCR